MLNRLLDASAVGRWAGRCRGSNLGEEGLLNPGRLVESRRLVDIGRLAD